MPSMRCSGPARGCIWPEMDRREYTDAVLSQLRRVTGDEREAIRAELDAHMEEIGRAHV